MTEPLKACLLWSESRSVTSCCVFPGDWLVKWVEEVYCSQHKGCIDEGSQPFTARLFPSSTRRQAAWESRRIPPLKPPSGHLSYEWSAVTPDLHWQYGAVGRAMGADGRGRVVMLTAYSLTDSTQMLIKVLINSMKQRGNTRVDLGWTSAVRFLIWSNLF